MLDEGDSLLVDAGKVGAFVPPKADDAVGLFDGALLVGGVGVGVVDRDAEGFLESLLVEELGPVVGGHALEGGEGIFAHHLAERVVDGLLRDGGKATQQNVAGTPIDHDEKTAFAGTP